MFTATTSPSGEVVFFNLPKLHWTLKQVALNQIFDSLATAVLVFDESLRLSWMNPAAEELLAVGKRQGEGCHLISLFPQSTSLVQRAQEVLAYSRVISQRGVWLELPGGHGHLVDLTLSSLSLGWQGLGLLIEATLGERHSRIAQEDRRLEEQRAVRRVIQGLVHEIKNPLGGLRGAAQLLERHLPEPGLGEYTAIIQHEVNRLLNLLERLRGPSGSRSRQRVNIHQILERVRRLVGAEAPAKVEIVSDYDPSLPNIKADFDQLVQVFLNLAQNAEQALEGQAGGGHIVLRTRVERHCTLGGQRHPLALRIEVWDNGPGIPFQEQSQIFYPLVTNRTGGRGLGLAIAQDLVIAHGGVIDLESRPGSTNFKVILPFESASNGMEGYERAGVGSGQ